MHIWPCFWTAVSPITGPTQPWLHYLPLWSGFFSVGYLLVIAGMKRWHRNPESKAIRLSITKSASPLLKRLLRPEGISRYEGMKASLFLSAVILALLTLGAWRMSRQTIVTQHNVVILHRTDAGDYPFLSSEQPNGDTFRPCLSDTKGGVDVDGMLSQATGYVAETARWEERGTCKSILRSDLGFWFKDAANNFSYRRIN